MLISLTRNERQLVDALNLVIRLSVVVLACGTEINNHLLFGTRMTERSLQICLTLNTNFYFEVLSLKN